MIFIKDLDKEYENYCENYLKGSNEITEAYKTMCKDFGAYLSVIQEHEWKEGFNYAMRLMMKDGAK